MGGSRQDGGGQGGEDPQGSVVEVHRWSSRCEKTSQSRGPGGVQWRHQQAALGYRSYTPQPPQETLLACGDQGSSVYRLSAAHPSAPSAPSVPFRSRIALHTSQVWQGAGPFSRVSGHFRFPMAPTRSALGPASSAGGLASLPRLTERHRQAYRNNSLGSVSGRAQSQNAFAHHSVLLPPPPICQAKPQLPPSCYGNSFHNHICLDPRAKGLGSGLLNLWGGSR